MWIKKLKIDGMTCPSCVVSIEKNSMHLRMSRLKFRTRKVLPC
jgi:hypothetical protein